MIALGLNHIGHAVSTVSTVLHISDRTKTAAPAVLTLLGFTPLQVELLIGGFVLTAETAAVMLLRLKSHLPNRASARQS